MQKNQPSGNRFAAPQEEPAADGHASLEPHPPLNRSIFQTDSVSANNIAQSETLPVKHSGAFIRGLAKIVKKEPVLLIALACALITMFFVPPTVAYLSYIDLRVLSLLFCLMAVVAGFEECGLFAVLAQKLLSGRKQMRLLCLLLVLLPYFTSMFITNDVALIAFVPFAILTLTVIGRQNHLIYVIVLQTVAANLGSMATPVGNPQNLFLYSKFELGIGDFFLSTLPFTLLSLLALICASFMMKSETITVHFTERHHIRHRKKLVLYVVLFSLCLLCVFRVLHFAILFAIIVICMALFARPLFKQVDYGLLITFVCFFIFAGNIGQIEFIQQFFAGLMHKNALITSLLVSQVISNMPAAVLLSTFTQDWKSLLIGVNMGGLGTIIASLASLISFKFYLKVNGANPLKYIGAFTLVSLAGLALLLGVYLLIYLP